MTVNKAITQVDIVAAKRYARRRIQSWKLSGSNANEREQLLIEAYLVIEKAAETFDASLASFQTYAYRRVTERVKETLRELNPLPRSLYELTQRDEDARRKYTPLRLEDPIHEEGETIGDFLPSPISDPEHVIVKNEEMNLFTSQLANAMVKLNRREKEIVIGSYYDNKSVDQLAKELKTTTGSIHTTKTKAMNKLRTYFQGVSTWPA